MTFGGGFLYIFESNISYNQADGALEGGGGILLSSDTGSGPGEATFYNSTFGRNQADNSGSGGGGVLVTGDAEAVFVYSTIAENVAINTLSGGIRAFGQGATVFLAHSLIAANLPTNCYTADEIGSVGFNLDEDASCGLNEVGDLSGVNPLLGSLQNNGGFTETYALTQGSPAIEAGNCSPIPIITTDQRGVMRPQGLQCDIGAYEFIWPTLHLPLVLK